MKTTYEGDLLILELESHELGDAIRAYVRERLPTEEYQGLTPPAARSLRWGELAGVSLRTEGDPWQAVVAAVDDRAMVARVTWATVADVAVVAFVDLTSHSQAWSRDAAETWQRRAFPCLRGPGDRAWRDRHAGAVDFADVVLRSLEWGPGGEFTRCRCGPTSRSCVPRRRSRSRLRGGSCDSRRAPA
jgi:hypothetical protein